MYTQNATASLPNLLSFLCRSFSVTICLCLVFQVSVFAQLKTIRGTVKDTSNAPVAGVTTSVKNGRATALTDVAGKINHTALSNNAKTIEIQAHQGGCGLRPCNTVSAFIHAVKLGIPTLELDCVISKDSKVVVSHDQFMSYTMLTPEGLEIPKEAQLKYNMYTMPYDSIRRYDAGSRYNPEFPEQQKIKTHKPLLAEVIDSVETYVKRHHLQPVQYNIEIKSLRGDGVYHPAPARFVALVTGVLLAKGVEKRVLIQSFDVRALQYLHKQYPALRTAYLVSRLFPDLQQNLNRLGFVPHVYSPEYTIVTTAMVEEAHRSGMLVIPWTIDKKEEMSNLINMGVDGMITNYPDVALEITSIKQAGNPTP